MSETRSLRAEVRNPMLQLPATVELLAYLRDHPELRAILVRLLGEIVIDARTRAQVCWARHKAPMAVYWKVVSVYCGHIRRAVKAHG